MYIPWFLLVKVALVGEKQKRPRFGKNFTLGFWGDLRWKAMGGFGRAESWLTPECFQSSVGFVSVVESNPNI